MEKAAAHAGSCLAKYLLCVRVLRLALGTGKQEVGENAKDEGAGDGGDGHAAEVQHETANAGDQDDGNGEQIFVLLQVNVLDHLQAGNGDEAVKCHTNATHHAGGDGVHKGHEGGEEGDQHSADGGGDDAPDGGVTGDSHTADGFAVGGVGAAAEDRTDH